METDLWIGVDRDSFNPAMIGLAKSIVIELRQKLDSYITFDPGFARSLVPYLLKKNAPPEAVIMTDASNHAGTGPMSAVAGLVAQEVGKAISAEFPVRELVIENGGDIYLQLVKDLLMSVYAGKSPLSGKIAVRIPARLTPLGVCTSSGTVGPSLSFGISDAVMVACRSTPLADALATAFGNKITSPDVLEQVLNFSEDFPEILSLVIICMDKAGIRGTFEVKFLE